MFPETFVAKQVLAYTRPGDVVFDPFCGRGTALLESLLLDRTAAGMDINPVAACVSGAKAESPSSFDVNIRLAELQDNFREWKGTAHPETCFFQACFHPDTFREIFFLREQLDWRNSTVDRFIAAVTLGCLHGESHKSPNYLGNRMPRTISTKPDCSVAWWASKGMVAPVRKTFDVLRHVCAYRLSVPAPKRCGVVRLEDARRADRTFPSLEGSVKLMITSPPYLNTTDYREDQWLRLWFLGGPPSPTKSGRSDDRYRSAPPYWRFLAEAWTGIARLLQRGSILVLRMGGTTLTKDEISDGLSSSLQEGLGGFLVSPLRVEESTEIRNRQTNAFRPGTSNIRYEHDFAFVLEPHH